MNKVNKVCYPQIKHCGPHRQCIMNDNWGLKAGLHILKDSKETWRPVSTFWKIQKKLEGRSKDSKETHQHRLLRLDGGLLCNPRLLKRDVENVLDSRVGGEQVVQLLAVVHLHVLHQPAAARALLPAEPKEPEVDQVNSAHRSVVSSALLGLRFTYAGWVNSCFWQSDSCLKVL